MKKTKVDILILGAGAAGLMAAKTLKAKGKKFILLEARDRIGGRVFTHPLSCSDAFSLPIELGPEFLHGETPVTDALTHEFQFPTYEVKYLYHSFEKGRLQPIDFWPHLAKVIGKIKVPHPDLSFAQYLKKYDHHSLEDQKIASRFVEGFDAADLDRVSTQALAEMKDQVTDPKIRRLRKLLLGYGPLLEVMATPLNTSIRLQHQVQEIRWKRGSVEVTGTIAKKRAFHYTAKKILITVPLSILRELQIEPKPTAIDSFLSQNEMGHVAKVMVELNTDFFKAYPEGFPFVTAPDLHFTTWWSAYPFHTPTLTAWAGGSRARFLNALSPAERAKVLIQDLAKLSHHSPAKIKKWIQKIHEHDWSADPHARGAYSYPSARASRIEHVQTAFENTLYFAGEAFHSEMSGTVEGALATGEAAALKLSNCPLTLLKRTR